MVSLDASNTKCLKKLQLKSLTLDYCTIGVIKASVIMNFGQKLQHISLKGNLILWQPGNGILLGAFHEIFYLDVSCQNCKSCRDDYSWSKWLPQVPKPFKNRPTEDGLNEIYPSLNGTNIYFLPKLHSLYLHHTLLTIHFAAFCWMNNSIVNIDVSYSVGLYNLIEISCFYHLKYLNLRGIQQLQLTMESFWGMPSLEVLMLGSSGVNDSFFLTLKLLLYSKKTRT